MKQKSIYLKFIFLFLLIDCSNMNESSNIVKTNEDKPKIYSPIENSCPAFGSLDQAKFAEYIYRNNYGEQTINVVNKDGVIENIAADFAFSALRSIENKSAFLTIYARICGRDTKEYALYEKQFLALEDQKRKNIELENLRIKEKYRTCTDKFTEQGLIEFQIYNDAARQNWEIKKNIFSEKLCKVSVNQKEACEEDMTACLELIPKYNQLVFNYSPVFKIAIIEDFILDRATEDYIVYGKDPDISDPITKKKLESYHNKCTQQFSKKFMDYATLNISEFVNLFFSFRYAQNPGHNGFTLYIPHFKHVDIEQIMCQKFIGNSNAYDDCTFDLQTCALVSLKTFEMKNKYDKIKK